MTQPSDAAIAKATALYNPTAQTDPAAKAIATQAAAAQGAGGPSQDTINYWAGQIDAKGAGAVTDFNNVVSDAYTKAGLLYSSNPNQAKITTANPGGPSAANLGYWAGQEATNPGNVQNAFNSAVDAYQTPAVVAHNAAVTKAAADTTAATAAPASVAVTPTAVSDPGTAMQPAAVTPVKPTVENGGLVDPAQRTVNATNETVAGQINQAANPNSQIGMLADNARRMAVRNAMESSNASGTADSTMNREAVAQGGNTAYFNAITPIATADAGTYSLAAGQNLAATNTGLLANAAAVNQADLTKASLSTSAAIAAAQNVAQKYGVDVNAAVSIANAATQSKTTLTAQQMQDLAQKYNVDVNAATLIANAATTANTAITTANVSAATSKYVADNNLDISKLTAASQAAISKAHDDNANILQNSQQATTIFNQYMLNMANISSSTTMNQDAKTAAAAIQTQDLQVVMDALKAATPGHVPDISAGLTKMLTDAAAASKAAGLIGAASTGPFTDDTGAVFSTQAQADASTAAHNR